MLRYCHPILATFARQRNVVGARHVSLQASTPYVKNSLLRALKREAAIDIHPEVLDALNHHRPVVALETALVTNGVAPPTNLEIARKLETIVRNEGAVPATIGIVGGRVKIGLNDADLQRLADTNRKDREGAVKVSRRDLGPVLATKKDGGTTICSTLIFAALAGIKVISTGGLGGVHRGGESTMDISADLQELARCPVGVVSCGVKSILDIGRTLEYLETSGVPVVTYGDTYDFPGFYCGKSGYKSLWKVDNARTAAEMLLSQWQLGLENGTLFAAPIPDQYTAQGVEIQAAVDQAIKESEENGMSKNGKEATPWLLSRVVELTGGKSLQSNLALLENTAVIGTRIAVEYAQLQDDLQGRSGEAPSSQNNLPPKYHEPTENSQTSKNSDSKQKVEESAQLVVIGASAVDITAVIDRPNESGTIDLGNSTVPGAISLTMGGVARNIAEAAHRIFTSRSPADSSATLLLSAVGEDEFFPMLIAEQKRLGMRTDGLMRTKGARTAVCNMLLDMSGTLLGGIADMDITRNADDANLLAQLKKQNSKLVAMDGNLSATTLSRIVQECAERDVDTFYEPTSVTKSASILEGVKEQFRVGLNSSTVKSPVTYISPNIIELKQVYQAASSEPYALTDDERWWKVMDSFGLGHDWRRDLHQLANMPVAGSEKNEGSLAFLVDDGVVQMAVNLLPFFQNIVVKCGDRGVVAVMRFSGESAKHSPWASERSCPSKRYIVSTGQEGQEIVVVKHYPAIEVKEEEIINVTGAGDSLVGALCAGIALDRLTFQNPTKLDALIHLAQEAAVLSLHSVRSVSPLLGNATSHSRRAEGH